MELFGGMADMHGEGLPLSYMFVVTDAAAPPHTKENVLVNWMDALKSRGIDPEFTLSDKDPSEIAALNRVWSKAKHQLCFWHMIRAVKRRLANNRELPAFYGSVEAERIFPFIDSLFLPSGQLSSIDKVCTHYSHTRPATLTCCRWPSNPLLKNHDTQYGSFIKAVLQSTLRHSL